MFRVGTPLAAAARPLPAGDFPPSTTKVEAGMAMRETVSDVVLETLHALGVERLFCNLGTDYPPIVESLAKYAAASAQVPSAQVPSAAPSPQVPATVLCPHENTAITAAHGYALATGRGQGVMVHVDVGTQNLGGSLHNAAVGRVPMLIFAGRSPLTTRGEHRGSRDNPIHFFQDVSDQSGIVRQYTKWQFNLELPEQAAYALQRGMRIMNSEPRGPIYVTAAREVLGMPVGRMVSDPPERHVPPTLGELPDWAAAGLVQALQRAQRPLVITSYLGRHPQAVAQLVALSEALLLPVIEAGPSYLNFPRTHPHHWGFRAAAAVREADLVLLLDTDVPWIHKFGAPPTSTPVVQLDVDPIKSAMVMWDFPVTESHQVETQHALPRLLTQAQALAPMDAAHRRVREAWLAAHRPTVETPLADASGASGASAKLTPASLSALLGEALPPETVVFNEAVTSADSVRSHTRRDLPGTYFSQPGGSLGWGGGTALGYKLARPDAEVVWTVGDGTFVFSVPSSVYMTATRYNAPFLTVIYNNGGWNAVKSATDRVYGSDSHAARSGLYQHRLGPGEHLEQVAGAFGCFTAVAHDADSFRKVLAEARAAVKSGTPAVINAHIVQQ